MTIRLYCVTLSHDNQALLRNLITRKTKKSCESLQTLFRVREGLGPRIVGRLPLKIKEENAFVASSDGLKTRRRTKRTAEKPIQLTVVSEEAVSSRPLRLSCRCCSSHVTMEDRQRVFEDFYIQAREPRHPK